MIGHRSARTSTCVLAWCAIATATAALAAPANVCPGRLPVTVDGVVLETPYCADFDLLGEIRPNLRAVLVIHGTERNADDYLTYVRDAATLAEDDGRTLLVAPQFLTAEELDAFSLPDDLLYWSSSGWKQGNRSQDTTAHPRPARISSFAVLEEFVLQLRRVAPELRSVVVAGHSAGGQFVQRFAAGNGLDGNLEDVDVRYLTANPSSYLYFSPERVVPGTQDSFAVPSDSDCPNWYNDYKYGLEDLNSYMSAVGASELAARYERRRLAYLLGENDDDPADPYLDTSCAASHQGSHRLERGEFFYRHIVDHFGAGVRAAHEESIIPGVGHNGRQMLQSDCALFYLFDKLELAAACSGIDDNDPPSTPTNVRRIFTISTAPPR
jgi:hypothetical protein